MSTRAGLQTSKQVWPQLKTLRAWQQAEGAELWGQTVPTTLCCWYRLARVLPTQKEILLLVPDFVLHSTIRFFGHKKGQHFDYQVTRNLEKTEFGEFQNQKLPNISWGRFVGPKIDGDDGDVVRGRSGMSFVGHLKKDQHMVSLNVEKIQKW